MGYIFLTGQATPLGFVTLITCLKTYKNGTRQESLFRTKFKGIRVDEFGESGRLQGAQKFGSWVTYSLSFKSGKSCQRPDMILTVFVWPAHKIANMIVAISSGSSSGFAFIRYWRKSARELCSVGDAPRSLTTVLKICMIRALQEAKVLGHRLKGSREVSGKPTNRLAVGDERAPCVQIIILVAPPAISVHTVLHISDEVARTSRSPPGLIEHQYPPPLILDPTYHSYNQRTFETWNI